MIAEYVDYDDPIVYDTSDPLWLPPAIAADMAGVRPATLRKWKGRGFIRTNKAGCYSMRDIENWKQQRNTAMIRQDTPNPE